MVLTAKTCERPSFVSIRFGSVADGSIVDDGVERAERIDLLCDLSSLNNFAEVADYDCLRLRDVLLCLVGAGVASCVQDDPVTLLNQQLRRHPAEAIS